MTATAKSSEQTFQGHHSASEPRCFQLGAIVAYSGGGLILTVLLHSLGLAVYLFEIAAFALFFAIGFFLAFFAVLPTLVAVSISWMVCNLVIPDSWSSWQWAFVFGPVSAFVALTFFFTFLEFMDQGSYWRLFPQYSLPAVISGIFLSRKIWPN